MALPLGLAARGQDLPPPSAAPESPAPTTRSAPAATASGSVPTTRSGTPSGSADPATFLRRFLDAFIAGDTADVRRMTTAQARENLPERTPGLSYEPSAVDTCTAGGRNECELLLADDSGDYGVLYVFRYARQPGGRYLVTGIVPQGDAG